MNRTDFLNPDAPPDKSQKYAQPERERRFLLAGMPANPLVVRTARITDLYFVATRIRLRRTVETAGDTTATIYKLTQKIPAPDCSPGLSTNFYLSEPEYDVLRVLPARELRKTRYSVPPFGIDAFDPPRHGLTLAEIEFFSDEEERDFPVPQFALAEVTRDIRFTGGRLVVTERDELRRTLATFGIRLGE